MHVYPYNSDETNDENWEIYFAAARCVCVLFCFDYFFFLLLNHQVTTIYVALLTKLHKKCLKLH